MCNNQDRTQLCPQGCSWIALLGASSTLKLHYTWIPGKGGVYIDQSCMQSDMHDVLRSSVYMIFISTYDFLRVVKVPIKTRSFMIFPRCQARCGWEENRTSSRWRRQDSWRSYPSRSPYRRPIETDRGENSCDENRWVQETSSFACLPGSVCGHAVHHHAIVWGHQHHFSLRAAGVKKLIRVRWVDKRERTILLFLVVG